MNFLNKILKGYGNLIKSCSKTIFTTFKIVLFLIFVLSLSILIVYPLWNLATESPESYTLLVLIATITIFLVYNIYKIIVIIKNRGLKVFFFDILYPKLRKLFFIILIGFLILLTVYIFSFSVYFGLIISIFILIFYGYTKFVYKS